MADYPYCKHCMVIRSLKVMLEEYQFFLKALADPDFSRMSDHARGSYHGRVSLVKDMTQELEDMIGYLEIESDIRGGM